MSNLQFPVCVEDALKAGKQLEGTLRGCHSREICHSDVKPANIYLTYEGEIVLGDFGSATPPFSIVHETTFGYWPGGLVASPSCDFFCLAASLLEVLDLYKPNDKPRLQDLRGKAERILLPELKELILGLIPHKEVTGEPGTPPQGSTPSFSFPSSLGITATSFERGAESKQGESEDNLIDEGQEQGHKDGNRKSPRSRRALDESSTEPGQEPEALMTSRQLAGISKSKAKRIRKKKREGKE